MRIVNGEWAIVNITPHSPLTIAHCPNNPENRVYALRQQLSVFVHSSRPVTSQTLTGKGFTKMAQALRMTRQ